MSLQSGILKYKNNKVHCIRIGSGSKLLIAFHGFGHDAGVFTPLAQSLPVDYTLVAIDLPGHGQTQWTDTHIRKKDLMAIVQGIKNDCAVERFSLLGYSLGGRVCLNIVEQQPNWIDKLVLLASDGLQKNIWYHLATQNILGRAVFKSVVHQPEGWLRKAEFLRKYKLLDESRMKFVRHQLMNATVRGRLSYVWPVTSRLIANIPIIKWNINKHKIEVHLFMGKYDRIFPIAQGEAFIKKLKNAQLHLLDTGHNLLTPEYFPEIGNVFR